MPDIKTRIRAAFQAASHDPDDDVVEELAVHATAMFEAALAEGCSDDEARARVERLIGDWTQEAPRLRRFSPGRAVAPPPVVSSVLTGIVADLRYGTRVLRRQPGSACVAVLTMALGIGASTALFTITYGVLWKPLPFPDSDRLVRITETRQGHEPRVRGTISNGPYREWLASHSTLESIGGWLNQSPSTLDVDGKEPSEVRTTAVTPTLFDVLHAHPLLGRAFRNDDAPAVVAAGGARRAIVLSYGLWSERFGGRADAIGRAVHLDGKPVDVIGVMPKEFAFPDRETRAWTVWLPPPVIAGGLMRMTIFQALARLRPGATTQQASAEGTVRAKSAPDPGLTAVALFGGRGPAEIRAVPAVDQMTADVRPALLVLLTAVVLLLATATANVASLQLARATARRREMAIRAAIGAGMGRLTRQLLAESAVIGAGGALGGLALTLALHRALPSLLPADFPRIDAVRIDWRVLLFAVAVSAIASLACGALPAWQARRTNLTESLSEDGNAPVGGTTRTRTARARALITASQLAVSCVLLVGAALLVRSFVALLHADRGYDATNVLTARVTLPADTSIERRKLLLEGIAERMRTLPGIRTVAYGNALPLLTSGGFRGFTFRPPIDPSVEVEANILQRAVSPEYMAALGLRLRAGRAFSQSDSMTGSNVVIANHTFAAKYLGPNAVGTSVTNLGMCRGDRDRDRWEVVGVVDDVRQGDVADAPQAELFLPVAQIGCDTALSQAVFVIRTAGDPAAFAAPLRDTVHEGAPTMPVDSIMSMEDRVMSALGKPRLYAVVLATLALFALTIAAAGVFGVLSYIVAQRSREIAVRTALGAHGSDIVRLVMRQFGGVAAAGIVAGLWVAFALSSTLRTVLYGVDAHDLASYVGVAVAMLAIAAAACLAPARRAARVNAADVLR